MIWLLLSAVALAGQWVPQEPTRIPASTPWVVAQQTGEATLLRLDPPDAGLTAWSGGQPLPLLGGPAGTLLLDAPPVSREVVLMADQAVEITWWQETDQGEAAAWNRAERALWRWAKDGGTVPPLPEAHPSLSMEWEARRGALTRMGEDAPDFLFEAALLDLEAVRARTSADHGEQVLAPASLPVGAGLEVEAEGPGVLILDTRLLVGDAPFRRYRVSVQHDGAPLALRDEYTSEDWSTPGWGWKRSLLVPLAPGAHTVRIALDAETADPSDMLQVEARLERRRPSLVALGASFPTFRLLSEPAAPGTVHEMERAWLLADPAAPDLARRLLGTGADELARARLIEHLADPVAALALHQEKDPTPLTALALARRWERTRDLNPALLLPLASLLPADPDLLADLADAQEAGFVRPRGAAIRQLARVPTTGTGGTRWSQVMPEVEGDAISILGAGSGTPRVLLNAGAGATVLLPEPRLQERFPVLRMHADDWVRYRVDGTPREGRGDLDEALSPGLHRVDVDQGYLLLLDGDLVDGGMPVRDRAAGPLPNAWTLPEPGSPVEVEFTIEGPASCVTLEADDGQTWFIVHDPGALTSPVNGLPAMDGGNATRVALFVGPAARQVRATGPADVRVAVAMRRADTDSALPTPNPWPDPLVTLAEASRALVDEDDPIHIARLRLQRAAALQAMGLHLTAQREARAVAATEAATPTQRATGWSIYQAAVPPVFTSEFPGPATVDAALAWAGVRLDPVPAGQDLVVLASRLTPPLSWPLHREASEAYLADRDVVSAWVAAQEAGPLGHQARLAVLEAGDWERVERMDRNGGTWTRVLPHTATQPSDGLWAMAREAMLGAPWPVEEYSVIRREARQQVAFKGGGTFALDLLYRDESQAVEADPWNIPIRVDGALEWHLLPEGHVRHVEWTLRPGQHIVEIGPTQDNGRALVLRASLDGEVLPPQVETTVHRLGPTGARATVAGPCLLRIRVHDGGPVFVEVEGRTWEVTDEEIIPVRRAGPSQVALTGAPDATFSLHRMNPCATPVEHTRSLPRPLDMAAPAPDAVAAVDHWMAAVAVPPRSIPPPPERRGTLAAGIEVGNDATGARDQTENYRYAGLQVAWLQRLQDRPLWLSLDGQGRLSLDGAPGTRLDASLDWVPWPHAARLDLAAGTSGGGSHLEVEAEYRYRFLLGPRWQLQPRIAGWAGAWTGAPDAMVDPAAWNAWSARHPWGLEGGSLLDWRPLRDGRLRFEVAAAANPDFTLDRAGGGVQVHALILPWTLVRLGPEAGWRFADADRAEGYLRTDLVAGVAFTPWSDTRRWVVEATTRYFPLEATVEGTMGFGMEWGSGRGLRDHSPLEQVFPGDLDLPLETR